MDFAPIIRFDKLDREVTLRSAKPEDAEALVRYLKVTSGETPFLLREPDEVTLSVQQEEAFLAAVSAAPRSLMLLATVDGEHAGNCSLSPVSAFRRMAHRCEIAIALYQEFCGCGIGQLMLETVLTQAKALGYEQAELEVIAGNDRAKALYESLGFREYGRLPDNMKYPDGHYADSIWMMKKL